MAVYGYRIHTMEPHIARKRTEDSFLKVEDVSKAGGEVDALDQFAAELRALREASTQLGSPTYYIDDTHEEAREQAIEEADDLPYFEVVEVRQDGRVLEVIVETGREADHDALVSRDGTHEPIKRKAAVRRSLVLFVFPLRGNMAVMVSEVRGRSYAGELLVQWITRRAQRSAVTVDDKGNRKEAPWLNWRLTPRIDGNRLDGILKDSANHAFKLRRRTVNAQGGRASYDIELVQWGLKKTPIEKVGDVLMKMAARSGQGSETDRRKSAAKDVLTLVEPDVGGVGFDDAELTFTENGKTQSINSETIEQLYVYPLGSKRPKAKDLRNAAAPVVQRIGPTLGIQANLSV